MRINIPRAKFVKSARRLLPRTLAAGFFSFGSVRTQTTQSEALWNGVCGMRPLGGTEETGDSSDEPQQKEVTI